MQERKLNESESHPWVVCVCIYVCTICGRRGGARFDGSRYRWTLLLDHILAQQQQQQQTNSHGMQCNRSIESNMRCFFSFSRCPFSRLKCAKCPCSFFFFFFRFPPWPHARREKGKERLDTHPHRSRSLLAAPTPQTLHRRINSIIRQSINLTLPACRRRRCWAFLSLVQTLVLPFQLQGDPKTHTRR